VVTSEGNSGASWWGDYDNDGRLDLFVALNGLGGGEHILFHNDGGGSFTRVNTAPTGFSAGGGGDWGDYDNDGDLDLFIAQYANGANDLLYRNDGGGTFTRITNGPVVISGGRSQFGVWGDYDNDGWLDLFVGNDNGEPQFLFHNNGDGTFTRVTQGDVVNLGGNVTGFAWADYDNDGFLDLFIARGNSRVRETNLLYHNGGNSNKWLTVVCAGRVSNRSGIGAKVRVKANIAGVPRWQLREINSGNGFQSSGLRAHFGLGDATNVDLVRIEWPSGAVQELRNVAMNQILTVKEPPVLTALGKDVSGAFRLLLKGGKGLPYTVEYSTNLIHWNWLTGFATTNMLSPVTDPDAGSSSHRFYRAREDD